MLASIILPSRCGQSTCDSDSACSEKFNDQYFCDKNLGTCRRKLLVYSLNPRVLLGLLSLFAVNVFTVSAGVSGSGLLYALIVFLFNFTDKDAIPLYKISNFFGSAISVGFIFTRRRKDDKNSIYLDWNILSFSLPAAFAGSIAGVFLADVLPGLVLSLLVIGSLVHVAKQSVTNLQEAAAQRIRAQAPAYDALPKFLRLRDYGEPKPLADILFSNFIQIVVVCVAFEITNLALYDNGSTKLGRMLGVPDCSFFAFILFLMMIGSCAFASLLMYPRVLESLGPEKTARIGLGSFFSGIITTVGISGSVFFSSLLLSTGIEPMVVVSVSGLNLFLTSFATVAQFDYLGHLDVPNAWVIAIVSLLGSLVGNFFIKKHLSKDKTKRVIPEILLIVTLVTLIVMPVISWYEYLNNNNYTKFNQVCK